MEGYCTKDFDSSVSTLHIEVKNLPEFEKLVNQAKEEADQLKLVKEEEVKVLVKYPDETDKTEGRSDDLIKVLDEAVEKKYQKIRETGKVYTGIQEFCQQLRWTNPQIAEYVRKKMMDLAIRNGDLK